MTVENKILRMTPAMMLRNRIHNRLTDAVNDFECGRPAKLARFLRSDGLFSAVSAEAREAIAVALERVRIKQVGGKVGRPLSEHYNNPILQDEMRALYQALLKRYQTRARGKGDPSPRQRALGEVARRCRHLRIDVETVRKVIALPKRKREKKP